jgi:hypothetical protein
VKPVKRLSTRHLNEFFKHINTISGITDDNDANRDRSAEVTRGTESDVARCKELCSTSALSPGTRKNVKMVEIQKLSSPKLTHENL